MSDDCFCGSGDRYLCCCGRYLEGGQCPDTPEQLMRSRYCAYVLAREDYLLTTWHPSTRPPNIPPSQVRWLGLKVIRAANNAMTGEVEFVARHKMNGKAQRLHEVSHFVNENGHWLYVNGKIEYE